MKRKNLALRMSAYMMSALLVVGSQQHQPMQQKKLHSQMKLQTLQ